MQIHIRWLLQKPTDLGHVISAREGLINYSFNCLKEENFTSAHNEDAIPNLLINRSQNIFQGRLHVGLRGIRRPHPPHLRLKISFSWRTFSKFAKILNTVFTLNICTRYSNTSYLNVNKIIWGGTRAQWPYGFPVCGFSNAHAQSSIWATDICIFAESFLKVSKRLRTAKALARLCLCAGSPEPLLVACVISTFF